MKQGLNFFMTDRRRVLVAISRLGVLVAISATNGAVAKYISRLGVLVAISATNGAVAKYISRLGVAPSLYA